MEQRAVHPVLSLDHLHLAGEQGRVANRQLGGISVDRSSYSTREILPIAKTQANSLQLLSTPLYPRDGTVG